jgi:hypothetical protein
MLGISRDSSREQEMADKIESHIQMQAEENERGGMAPVEARRRAVLKLGGAERTRQAYRELGASYLPAHRAASVNPAEALRAK